MSTDQQALDRLAAVLVDDILALSDDEVLAEVLAEGGDVGQIAAELRALAEQTIATQAGPAPNRTPPPDAGRR